MENSKYSEENINNFWNRFLEKTKRNKVTKWYEIFHFCSTEKLANELLELVLSGRKRATSSSLKDYEIEGDPIPVVGDLSIVTDWDGVPRCVIETTQVTIIPFCDMTYDICKREGEDDVIDTWIEGHRHFFTLGAQENGYEFTEDIPVLFEDFKVVYQE